MIGVLGLIGALGNWRRRVPASPGGSPDFTLSNASVITAWGVVAVGNLVPNAETPAGAYFVLVDEPAGFAVENG
jgi:hypothetical protein